jgi:hypothetical protein
MDIDQKPVAVKALQWCEGSHGRLLAYGIDGRLAYEICDATAERSAYWLRQGQGLEMHHVDTLEAAKADAQADFEARILEALIPAAKPVGVEGLTDEMVERACVELIRHDPNWSQYHWPTDKPRKVEYQSGYSRMSSPVWGEHLASIRTRARAALDAALSAGTATPGGEKREVAWLIERKDYAGYTGPHWYAENVDGGWHWWTPAASDAKRFASKAEAEAYPAYQMIASDPTISITEHVFLEANP